MKNRASIMFMLIVMVQRFSKVNILGFLIGILLISNATLVAERTIHFRATPLLPEEKPATSFSLTWRYDSELHIFVGSRRYVDISVEDFNVLVTLLDEWMDYGAFLELENKHLRAKLETTAGTVTYLKNELEKTKNELTIASLLLISVIIGYGITISQMQQ